MLYTYTYPCMTLSSWQYIFWGFFHSHCGKWVHCCWRHLLMYKCIWFTIPDNNILPMSCWIDIITFLQITFLVAYINFLTRAECYVNPSKGWFYLNHVPKCCLNVYSFLPWRNRHCKNRKSRQVWSNEHVFFQISRLCNMLVRYFVFSQFYMIKSCKMCCHQVI